MPTYSLTLSVPFEEYVGFGLTEPGWIKATSAGPRTVLWAALHNKGPLRRWATRQGLADRFAAGVQRGCIDLAEIQASDRTDRNNHKDNRRAHVWLSSSRERSQSR